MSEAMAQPGVISVPHARWGGRWMHDLKQFDGCDADDWVELAEYKETSGYQVARALNLGSVLPEAPDGKRFEFGSRVEGNGTSILLVRCVDEEEE